jgi:transcriptional regulator with XRE-family HTH domain
MGPSAAESNGEDAIDEDRDPSSAAGADRSSRATDRDDPFGAFGKYLRAQRQLAQLSLRQLAELTRVSNPYLSQIERGLHQPSVAVIKALAQALNLSVEELLAQAAGVAGDDANASTTESAIRNDPRLDQSQKSALLAVYRSMVESTGRSVPEGGSMSD